MSQGSPTGGRDGPTGGASSGSGSQSTTASSKPHIVKQAGAPGLRGMETTSVFRVVNFELFAKPNKFIMAVGLAVLSGCVAYIAYWNATSENRKSKYTAMDEHGNFHTRKKESRWD